LSNLIRREKMNNKGFTLMEILIVVAIISILAIIGIPGYIGQQKRAARTEAFTNLEALGLLQEQFFAENGRYAPDPDATFPYKGTYGAADGGIEDVFRSFKPGPVEGLQFEYELTSDSTGTVFNINAVGRSGTRVEGEFYFMDQDNTRNF
jgi:prepilin-type N-terminal cleavage/methylation domain-containing protein